ncbi:MAG: hypothetical protein Fur0015_14570 [Ignavibacteriales bacterium]
MKNVILFLFVLLSLVTFSCSEELNPFQGYQKKYALNCIIRGDSLIQFASVTSSFPSDKPFAENPSDRFLKNVDLRLWSGDEVYRFKDSTFNTVIYGKESNVTVYYINNFVTNPDNELEIEALLPDGKRLKSKTRLPKTIYIEKSVSDTSIPSKDGQNLFVRWLSSGDNLIYAPEINIYYKKAGFQKGFAKKVPIQYVKQGGKYYPDFASPSNQRFINVQMDAIRRAMSEISEGDPNKQNYTILTMIVHVHAYDKNLSEYYVSTSQSLDQFSVNLDALDYSNIDGGYGIFGSYFSKQYVIKFNREFIGSFGYKVGIEE